MDIASFFFLAEERYRANIFLSFNFFTHDKLKLCIVLYKSCYLSPNFSPALVCKFLVFSGLPNSLFNFMLSVVTCYRLKPELLSLRPYETLKQLAVVNTAFLSCYGKCVRVLFFYFKIILKRKHFFYLA